MVAGWGRGSAFSEVDVLNVFVRCRWKTKPCEERLTAMPFGSIAFEDRFTASDHSHIHTYTWRGGEEERKQGGAFVFIPLFY